MPEKVGERGRKTKGEKKIKESDWFDDDDDDDEEY